MNANTNTVIQRIISAVVRGDSGIVQWICRAIQCDASFADCPNYPRRSPIGSSDAIDSVERLSGGCINACYGVHTGDASYFVKLNDRSAIGNFFGELYGIIALSVGAVRVPFPIAVGAVDSHAFMVYEYLSICGNASADDWQRMGQQLARLHTLPVCDINQRLDMLNAPSESLLPTDGFGGHLSNTTLSDGYNYTGTHPNWEHFFTTHRIEMQLTAMRSIHGHAFRYRRELRACVHALLGDYRPHRSLTHGDLWGGNAGFFTLPTGNTAAGAGAKTIGRRRAETTDATTHAADDADASTHHTTALIYDAAPYIADAEVDLAMTELFGGFGAGFYRGYHSVRPQSDGYAHRAQLYNLYHILNHYNLFGGGYLAQAEHTVASLYRLV